MVTAYAVAAIITALANIYAASVDFMRPKHLLISMAKVRVPESWLVSLGILKATGALGLIIGFWLPVIGTAAAIGLTLFFVVAISAHLRARDNSFGFAVIFLVLAAVTLASGLLTRGHQALALLPK